MKEVRTAVLAAVVAAVGSLGFVAAAGGGILWSRFEAAKLPADQAVAVVPRDELVSVGAVALVGFIVTALLAVAVVYWLDDEGKPSPPTRLGIVVLALVEILVAILYRHYTLGTGVALSAAFLAAAVGLAYAIERGSWDGLWSSWPHPWAVVRTVLAAILLLVGGLVVAMTDQWLFAVVWAIAAAAAVASLGMSRPGVRRIAVVAVLVYAGIALGRFERWLAFAAFAALALAAINLGVAQATRRRFAFYGVSVFLSVVLFGAVLSYARTADFPKLQPVAVLMKDGAGSQCGLYVTETDKRLYLARVAVVPRRGRTTVVPASGRIFWVPRERIDRTELGALQDIAGAQEDASLMRDELLAEQPAAPATTEPTGPSGPTGGAGPTGAESVATAPTRLKNPAATEPKGAAATAAEANKCISATLSPPPRETPQRELARRFQPRVILDRGDRFWPISVLTMFKLKHGDRRTCRRVAPGECTPLARPSQLPWIGGIGEWIEYPGSKTNAGQAHEDMVDALGSADPVKTAREYFFATGGGDGETTSLQYWFYYAFNYQELGYRGHYIGHAGHHQGDFESIGLLLSKAKKDEDKHAVYEWMARHDDEGRPFLASESQLGRVGDHPTVYSALGSHASYDSCARQHRPKAPGGLINDRPQCAEEKQLVLEPEITPLSDLALAPWVCWQGRFGHSATGKVEQAARLYFAAGPRSPLYQQKFGAPDATPCAAVRQQPSRPDAGEEVLSDGVGTELRNAGGRLDGLFNTCAAWYRAPAAGIYVLACDGDALTDFFKSGLTDMGDRGITMKGPDPREESEAPGIPGVYRRADAVSPDGVSMTAGRDTKVTVYAVCYSGEDQIVATFPSVAIRKGHPVTLKTSDATWALSGAERPASATPKTSGGPARCAK